MHTLLLGTGLAIAASSLLLFAGPAAPSTSPAPSPHSASAGNPPGHVVLVVEGDRDGLQVTRALPKAEPWGGLRKGIASAWQVRLLDDRGAELRALPIDLSGFDLDRKDGVPQRQGCVLRPTRVAMLVNVPHDAGLVRAEFRRAGVAKGTTDLRQVGLSTPTTRERR